MGEDTNITSDEIALESGEHIQILGDNSMFNQDSDGDGAMCTVILDPSNVTFIPVMPLTEGEEVVMYDIVDGNIKVEIAEENEVYAEEYIQEILPPKPTKTNSKPSRHGPHICKVCNKSFAQVVNLVTHERIHTGEKPFKCSVCSKPFSQQPNLWKHMRIHTGERPYQCNTCKKCFTQQANLTKHMRIHTGERPYVCQYCGKCFTQQANLTKHVRLHTGERPFHCRFCSKTFVQQSNLERHERTHTGVKPFQCNICFESFTQNAHLSKHLRTVHRNVEKPRVKKEDNQPVLVGEVKTESGNEVDILSEFCGTTKCIPVLYCTKTGRIIRRID